MERNNHLERVDDYAVDLRKQAGDCFSASCGLQKEPEVANVPLAPVPVRANGSTNHGQGKLYLHCFDFFVKRNNYHVVFMTPSLRNFSAFGIPSKSTENNHTMFLEYLGEAK